MFNCPHCNATFNNPITKTSIIDEETGEEFELPKEARIRICPYCNEKFDFDSFVVEDEDVFEDVI